MYHFPFNLQQYASQRPPRHIVERKDFSVLFKVDTEQTDRQVLESRTRGILRNEKSLFILHYSIKLPPDTCKYIQGADPSGITFPLACK